MTTEHSRDIASWRREYEDHGLTEADLPADPIDGFRAWLSAAGTAGLHEPNAMVVSTVDPTGAPSSRMVLLKSVDARGFVFYTNFESRKATELVGNPRCSLLVPWHPLERQIRVEGVATRTKDAESDAYFRTRPRGAQLGAWASPQSQPVPSREYLQERYAHEVDRFEGVDMVPRPPQWGGFVVRPHLIEFWQGRPGRMHDRVQFVRADDSTWVVERLAP
ncbi:MAG: pyridoxamine 5'-phosphate oxidase [Nocardioidaceae bacterium]|nr:pyridoxamine 5'-phosphate oxidase [Nocardioidaceae bacterium]